MWFIKSKFEGEQGNFTEELENASDEQYSQMKYKRRVEKWLDILTKCYCKPDDVELQLKIIDTILKHKNDSDNKNRSFTIERYV